MTRAFVGFGDVEADGPQLIEARTPTAYAGVENYARQHAGTTRAAWHG